MRSRDELLRELDVSLAAIRQSFIVALNSSGNADSDRPDGSDPIPDIEASWLPVPDATGRVEGTPFEIDLAALVVRPITETVVVTRLNWSAGNGWDVSGSKLQYSGTGVRAQEAVSYRATLSPSGKVIDYTQHLISSVADAGGTDTLAPTYATGLTATPVPDAAAINVSIDRPGKTNVGSSTVGLKEVRWFLGGVFKSATSIAAGTPSLLTGADIGTVGAAGSSVRSGRDYLVTGAAQTFNGTTDNGQFALEDVSGDFELTCYLESVTGANAASSVALVARSTDVPGSPASNLFVTTARTRTRTRSVMDAATVADTPLEGVTWPCYLRKRRVGDTIEDSVSLDGKTWTLVAARTLSLGPVVKVGLAIASGTAGASTVAAQFRNVKLARGLVTPVTAQLTGLAYATNYTVTAVVRDLNDNDSTAPLSVVVTTVNAPSTPDPNLLRDLNFDGSTALPGESSGTPPTIVNVSGDNQLRAYLDYDTSPTRFRSEVYVGEPRAYDVERWYGIRLWYPSDRIRLNSGWEINFQIHQTQGGAQPPFAFSSNNDQINITSRGAGRADQNFAIATLEASGHASYFRRGSPIDIIVCARWSYTNTGYLRVYTGQSETPIWERTGISTCYDERSLDPDPQRTAPTMKCGLYNGWGRPEWYPVPVGAQKQRAIFIHRIKVGGPGTGWAGVKP